MKIKPLIAFWILSVASAPSSAQPSLPPNQWVQAVELSDPNAVDDEAACSGKPCPRSWFPLDYHAGVQRIILVGGGVAGGCGSGYVNDVWELSYDGQADGWQWVQRRAVDRTGGVWPQGQDNHVMAYDATNQRLWILGGTCSGGFGFYDYATNNFTQVGDFQAADPNEHDDGVFDPGFAWGEDRLIVFSGEPGWLDNPGFRTSIFDTTSTDVSGWTNAQPATRPRARMQIEEVGVWVPTTRRFLIFGGGHNWVWEGGADEDVRLADTWEYDPQTNTWTEICGDTLPACGPQGREQHVMVYDSAHDVVILHGGTPGSGNLSDTWVYDPQSRAWTELTGANGPAKRLHGAAYDANNDVMLIWSGAASDGNNIGGMYVLRYSPGGGGSSGNQIVPLRVTEPAGMARSNAQITSGVPLPAGTDTASLSLWNGAQEIPVQITPLSGTSSEWVLLDFQLESLGAGQTAVLSLRDAAATAAPPDPVAVADNGSQYVIDTGPMRVVIGHDGSWDLFDEVWTDTDQDGQWDSLSVSGLGGNLELVGRVSGSSNATAQGAGTPDRVTWEYGGPGVANAMRATLKIEGTYAPFTNLRYTTRLSFHAGASTARIEHLIRNSYPDNETYAKIGSATLRIGDGSATVRPAEYPPLPQWAQVTGQSGATIQLVPSTIYNGIGADSNGGMLLPDLSYHGVTAVIDFAQGDPSTSEVTVRSPLFAVADGSWYSQHGQISADEFGDLTDETTAYNAWGWTLAAAEPTEPHRPTYTVGWEQVDVHGDLESDDLWQNALMYLRTGSRGYWDRARGWARYYSLEFPMRTDGFDYMWDGNAEDQSDLKDRPIQQPAGLTGADSSFLADDFEPGKVDVRHVDFGGDHMFGWGLVDYYHLTGDNEALDALRDLGEVSERILGHRAPGSYAPGAGGMRLGGRQWLMSTRLYEVTGDPRWQSHMDHVAQLHLQSPAWWTDANGGGTHWEDDWNTDNEFGSGAYSSGVRQISAFQHTIVSHAYERYYHATSNAAARDRVIAMAKWTYSYGLQTAMDYSGKRIGVCTDLDGQPGCSTTQGLLANEGDVAHGGMDWGGECDPFYTNSLVDSLVRGYKLNGDVRLLNRARHHWQRGHAKSYGCPWTIRDCADGVVCRYMNNAYDGIGDRFVSSGDLPYTYLLAAQGVNSTGDDGPGEGDTVPPAQVTDLQAAPASESSILLQWTAPGDDGNDGVATGYDLRYSGTAPIVSEADYQAATRAVGEPAPSPPGSTESMTVAGLAAETTYHFALKVSDEASNLSPLSNPASGSTGADATPPVLLSASASGDATRVRVQFSEAVEQASATEAANYGIDNGIIVQSATLDADPSTVILITSAHVTGVVYTLSVSGVRDRASQPNTIAPDSQVDYTYSESIAVSNLSVASGKAYEVANNLQDQALAYIDRDFLYGQVPLSVQGATYIRTANDDKSSNGDATFLSFDVSGPVTVYVVHDDQYGTKPAWMSTFVDTGEDLWIGATFSLFRRDFPAGTVQLGGNAHPSEIEDNSMYTVIIVGATAPAEPPVPPGTPQVY